MKNIPPAGRERNRLIAKTKGIEPAFACYADNVSGDDYCVWDTSEPYNCLYASRGIKKEECKCWCERPEGEYIPEWSTDRNDAWELWGELPEPKRYDQLGIEHIIYAGFSQDYMGIKDCLIYEIKGNSFADAVSKAWLEFKGWEEKELLKKEGLINK